jgi:hypothetical protein
MESGFYVGGKFTADCYDENGNLVWSEDFPNGVTNTALNDLLNIYLRNGTPTAAWYMGLVDNAGFTLFAAADTAASHAGWSEFTAYSGSNRPQWSPGAASGQAVVNGTTVDFAITGTGTIKGAFIISNNTKGGTSGTLYSTGGFDQGNQAVSSGYTLKVTYTAFNQVV